MPSGTRSRLSPPMLPQIPFLEIAGHSGIADAQGVSSPDLGPAHIIDQGLDPSTYRSIAMGSAVASWHNQGNGANGDGGWAHFATEFPRQEEIAGYNQTTVSGASSGTTLNVTSAVGIAPSEFLAVGSLTTPAQKEIVQVAPTYAGGTAVPLVAALANAKAAGDPVYHAPRNVGGNLPKSAAVIIDIGGNDPPYLGPRDTVGLDAKVFGTNPGAARGMTPLKHAIRAMIAIARCSQIYRAGHPACQKTGAWSSGNAASVAGLATASWAPIWQFGGNGGTYDYVTAASGQTHVFVTDPDFAGGTVDFFSLSYHNPSGAGGQFSITVSGATTRGAQTFDCRNQNAVNFNDAAGQTTAKSTICVYRITGLNPGVNVITATVSAIATYGIVLGWGVEATDSPAIDVPLQFRLGSTFAQGLSYGVWYTQPYYRRTQAAPGQASVSAGAGTAAGSVTLNGAVTVGTTGTTNAAVYPGDTITLDAGNANEETRRVVAVAGTGSLSVDANFVNAHTNAPCVIGFQHADFVGGGYRNRSDTQGKASVPGMNAAIQSVVDEFADPMVRTTDLDSVINPPGPGANPPSPNPRLANDGVHHSNFGGGESAVAVLKTFTAMQITPKKLSRFKVSNRRFWIPIYGETTPAGQPAYGAGAQAIFYNGHNNSYPSFAGARPRSGFYKIAQTRQVVVRIAAIAGTDSYITILPLGYRPIVGEGGMATLEGIGSAGSVTLIVNNDGTITYGVGYPGSGGWILVMDHFLAEYP
jgi:hypothetical protein